MGKILTAQIKVKMYFVGKSRWVFPEYYKEYIKEVKGVDDTQYIDQNIIEETKKKAENIAIA